MYQFAPPGIEWSDDCREGVIAVKSFESIARELQSGAGREELQKLSSSADGKKLESMVDGAALEKAMQRGDAAALQKMLASLLSTPEGRRLAGDVQRIMGK